MGCGILSKRRLSRKKAFRVLAGLQPASYQYSEESIIVTSNRFAEGCKPSATKNRFAEGCKPSATKPYESYKSTSMKSQEEPSMKSEENSLMEPAETEVRIESIRKIGEGKMNVFWQFVRHGRRFFVKSVNPEYLDQARAFSLLRKEFDLGMRLDDRGVVRYISLEKIPEAGESILMEWVDGETLGKWLKTDPSKSQRIRMAREIIQAMCYVADAGVVHRDLKPDNIMVRRSEESPVIIDFGHGDSEDFLTHKLAAGTASFGAPEQHSHLPSGFEADVYSLGKILEALKLPKGYKNIIDTCLKEEPQDRPDIHHLLTRFRNATRVRKWFWPVLVVLVSLIIVVSLLLLMFSNPYEYDTVIEGKPQQEQLEEGKSVETDEATTNTSPENAKSKDHNSDIPLKENTGGPPKGGVGGKEVKESSSASTGDSKKKAESLYADAVHSTDVLIANYRKEIIPLYKSMLEADSYEASSKIERKINSRTQKLTDDFNKISKQMEDQIAGACPDVNTAIYSGNLAIYYVDVAKKVNEELNRKLDEKLSGR